MIIPYADMDPFFFIFLVCTRQPLGWMHEIVKSEITLETSLASFSLRNVLIDLYV